MKFNDEFKINPLICCGRDGGGPGESDTSDGGGGSNGGNSNSNDPGDNDSNSDGGNGKGVTESEEESNERGEGIDDDLGGDSTTRSDINAVNNPKDYAYAKDLIDKTKAIKDKYGLTAAAAFAKTLAATYANPVAGVVTAVKEFKSLSKAKQDAIKSAVNDLMDKHDIDPARAKDMADYFENSLNSRAPGDPDDRNGNDHNLDDISIDSLVAASPPDATSIPEPPIPPNGMPSSIPDQFLPGIENYVEGSQIVTDQLNTKADQLWEDYLEFEKTFFDKYENNLNQYNDNLASIPKMNMTMPGTMGGATIPLAPKVHSAMFTDQLNARNSTVGDQANTQLAGLGSRDALAKNQFSVGMTNLNNLLMPTQVGLDLYKMERAGQLGLDQVEAGKNNPSTLSTWAPVVGSILNAATSKDDDGNSAISSAWDYIFNSE